MGERGPKQIDFDDFDWGKLDGLLQFDAPINFCAEQLRVSHDTLERRVLQEKGMTIAEYKGLRLGGTATKIKSKMIAKALQGDNVCMIFVLKNIGMWSDRTEVVTRETGNKTVVLKYKLEKLEDDK